MTPEDYDAEDDRPEREPTPEELIQIETTLRARTADEAARFANLLRRQLERDRIRGLLVVAQMELNEAQRAVDDPTRPFMFMPDPSVPLNEQLTRKQTHHLMQMIGVRSMRLLFPTDRRPWWRKTIAKLFPRQSSDDD